MGKHILNAGVFCLMLLLIAGCGKSVDLSSFAKIIIDGYDGKATASLDVDWGQFEKAVMENIKANDFSSLGILLELSESVKYSLDKTEGLSNGDKVTMTVIWDKKVAKKYKQNFTVSKKEVEVSGLEPLKEIDLFAEVYVDYKGVAPEASAMVRNASSDAFLKGVYYSIDNSYNLSNGDTVTVTASNITPADAEKKGYLISETKKTYTVSGIDEFIQDYGAIDSQTFEKMDKQARDVVESYLVEAIYFPQRLYRNDSSIWFENIPRDSYNMKDAKLIHSYFLTLKKDGYKKYNIENNSLFMVYEVKFSTSKTKAGEVDIIYVPIYFSDIIKRGDGTIDVVLTKAKTMDSNNSVDNIHRDVVTANKAEYECEEIDY